MAIPVLPFKGADTIIQPAPQVYQKRPSPWANILPTLTQSLVMGLVQDKLASRQAQRQFENEMVAKGYEWNDEKKTWLPKPPDLNTVAKGVTLARWGPYMTTITDPETTASIEQASKERTMALGQQYDLEKIAAQSNTASEKAKELAQINLDNAMTERGAVKDESGNWTYAPPKFGKDPMTGQYYMQLGSSANLIKPRAEAKVEPMEGLKNFWRITQPDGDVQITKIEGDDTSWIDSETGTPKTFQLKNGLTGMFNSKNSAVLFEKPATLSTNDLIEKVQRYMQDINADKTTYNKAMTSLTTGLASGKDPLSILNEVTSTSSRLAEDKVLEKYKTLADVEKGFANGDFVNKPDLLKRAFEKFGIK